MAMIKVVGADSWNFGEDPVQQIKVASNGLSGDDLKSFVKRAGHYLADIVKKLEMKPGEVPIHLIALGATEAYQCNRNGDGFKEASCIKFHPTFEKFAKFYRNHDNRPSSPSYGVVKKSIYNPEMRRVELIVGLNETKEAADRNGGFVADKELEKLASGKDLGVSMSCRVAHDECSWCGNKAKTRKEYCSEDNCGGGGLKNHMGAVLKCGHVLHADNPEPIFFDISHVVRPADRTAFVTGVLNKEASSLKASDTPPVSDEVPSWVPKSIVDNKFIKIARELSYLESKTVPAYLSAAFRHEQTPLALNSHFKVGHALSALADENVILPVEEFLALALKDREKAASVASQVRAQVPGAYGKLLDSEYFSNFLDTVEWTDCPPLVLRKWASTAVKDYGLDKKTLLSRLDRGVLENKTIPQKSFNVKTASTSNSLACLYAAYTLKAIEKIETKIQPSHLTREAVIAQNYFC